MTEEQDRWVAPVDPEETPEKKRLYEACLGGHKGEILKCLESVNPRDYLREGMTAYHWLVMSGREDIEPIIGSVFEAGVDVNAVNVENGDTGLHLIIKNREPRKSFPIVLKILEYNPDLDIRNKQLRTPYDVAMAQGYYDMGQVLDGTMTAEEAREFYNRLVGDSFGQSLVDAIMQSQDEYLIEETLYFGADPNYINQHGAGAIHYLFTHFSSKNPLKVLAMLIKAGGDINLRDYEGDTALNLVIKSENPRLKNEMYRIVSELLKNGARTTFKDLDGYDALALASKRGYKEIVKLLRRYRTSHYPNEDDDTISEEDIKDTPIGIEDKENVNNNNNDNVVDQEAHPEEVHQIKKKNTNAISKHPDTSPRYPYPANPNSKYALLTPRNIAVEEVDEDDEEPYLDEDDEDQDLDRKPYDDLSDLLMNPDGDLDKINEEGLAPLHIAIRMNKEDDRNYFVEELLMAGANIDVRATKHPSHREGGNTPLLMAVERNYITTVEILLKYSPNLNDKNAAKKTADDIAVEKEYAVIKELLDDKHREIAEKWKRGAKKARVCSIQ